MIAVYKLIGQAAGTRATVLIRGESGTGKELVARAIHSNSAHASEPFVPVNCAALPTTLLESELFGHTRGAFTGAVNARKGRFALAGRGAIFLDEIGDTSAEFQTKLLRVIQDREFEPLGAEKTERTEARVIAATHRDLEQMIEDGTFREDLYYRLRVVEVVLPPLRERRSDIPILAAELIRRTSLSVGAPAVVLSDEALARLMEHAWPGNVRELENCLARAVVVASGGVIRPEHLSIAFPREPMKPTIASLNRGREGAPPSRARSDRRPQGAHRRTPRRVAATTQSPPREVRTRMIAKPQRVRATSSIRARFLAVVLLGAVVPLATHRRLAHAIGRARRRGSAARPARGIGAADRCRRGATLEFSQRRHRTPCTQ